MKVHYLEVEGKKQKTNKKLLSYLGKLGKVEYSLVTTQRLHEFLELLNDGRKGAGQGRRNRSSGLLSLFQKKG